MAQYLRLYSCLFQTTVHRSHVTCDLYFPLWRRLLEGDFKTDVCDPQDGRRWQSVFLSEFFKSSLSIMERLNLRTTQKDEDEEEAGESL